jgi:hypothetical protein
LHYVGGFYVNSLRGAGGDASATGIGGKGSTVSALTIKANLFVEVGIYAGIGGTGATGGEGGSVTGLTATASADDARFGVYAGRGGSGGTGGLGGSVSKAKIAFPAGALDEVEISAGSGGAGAAGRGGNGGTASDIAISSAMGTLIEGMYIYGGRGESSSSSHGGDGGGVARVAVKTDGVLEYFEIQAGRGGGTNSSSGNGGDGGGVETVSLAAPGGLSYGLYIEAGTGAHAGITSGTAGDGGAVRNLTIATGFGSGRSMDIYSGNGGSAAIGGQAGNIESVKISDPWSAIYGFYAGDGGSSEGANGAKAGGNVSGVAFKAPLARAEVFSGRGGNAVSAAGGAGGDISGITGTIGLIIVEAGYGGDSTNNVGGNGGSVHDLKLTATQTVQYIRAGDGGYSNNGLGGNGGSISRIKIGGDIGNFSASFGIYGMGGLIAGQGREGINSNGSVESVSASRIAAIFAGNESSVLSTNAAVKSIAKITARVIGADLNGDGQFAFSETGASGYILNSLDAAIDGLVVVRNGGFDDATVSVAPLKLATVAI